VIPMRTRFTICKNGESVGQGNGSKMMHFIVHEGSQTESAIAGCSEADHIGVTTQLSLCHVMIRHLPRHQSAGCFAPADSDQLQFERHGDA